MLWRNFAEVARVIDNIKGTRTSTSDTGRVSWPVGSLSGDSKETMELLTKANDTAGVILQNQRILDGLMESIEKDGATINLCLESL